MLANSVRHLRHLRHRGSMLLPTPPLSPAHAINNSLIFIGLVEMAEMALSRAKSPHICCCGGDGGPSRCRTGVIM